MVRRVVVTASAFASIASRLPDGLQDVLIDQATMVEDRDEAAHGGCGGSVYSRG